MRSLLDGFSHRRSYQAGSRVRMHRKALVLCAALFGMFCSGPAAANFVISYQPGCSGGAGAEPTYEFHFSEAAALPDWSVTVTRSSVIADIYMQLVDDPMAADLIVADDLPDSHMKVCKVGFGIGRTVIKVTERIMLADITVKLSESPQLKGPSSYKIFVGSSEMTTLEAVALFAVIWASNRQ